MNVFPGITSKHLETLHTITSGAAPLGAMDEQKLLEKAKKNIAIFQGYGLSEAPVVTTQSHLQKKHPGSIGLPIANTTVKVVGINDESGIPLGPNQIGELYVKGPQVMRGYHDNQKATEESFSPDGWLKSGDMVYYDEEGYFYVTDRIKELIKVKGYQVAPAELEELIRDFDGVVDACVIGVPHETQGEVPRAYVVPKKGATLDASKLAEYVAGKVAPYKQLQGGIAVVEAIPKTASGKLLRRQLKAEYTRGK